MPTADQLIDLIRPDFDALNELLISQLGSEIDLIEEVSQYLIQSGGKRVRPLVTLMAARALKRIPCIIFLWLVRSSVFIQRHSSTTMWSITPKQDVGNPALTQHLETPRVS